uniref:Uncharacterized protein n=1 Tax=Caenorhabditis tropicalis TaxID=1561998 RepID=A0A1I7TAQ2_9PELO
MFTRRLLARQTGKILRPNDVGYLSASERNDEYGLQSLETRRCIIDYKFLARLQLGKVDLDAQQFFQVNYSNTRSHSAYHWKAGKTKIRRCFYVNRTLSRTASIDPRPTDTYS